MLSDVTLRLWMNKELKTGNANLLITGIPKPKY